MNHSQYRRLRPFQKGLFTGLMVGAIRENREKAVNPSQVAEAEVQGITLLCRSTDPNYNKYRFNICRHEQFCQPTHIRRNNVVCNTCLLLRNVTNAHTKGFHLLHKSTGPYYIYRRPCGHISRLSPQAVMNNAGEKCNQCFDEQLISACEKNGYVYTGQKAFDKNYHCIGFSTCNHTKHVHHQQIFKGNVVCRECEALERQRQASLNGLVELEHVNDRYFKYQLPCGHSKVLRADHVISNSYLCDVCGDSHYQKPSKLYLHRFSLDGFSWLKLGFARNIELRKASYGVDKRATHNLLLEIDFDLGRDAMLFEKKLHGTLKNHRLDKKLMRKFHKFNGFSECYPVEAQELILTTINLQHSNKG
jgi:hypothetical protein